MTTNYLMGVYEFNQIVPDRHYIHFNLSETTTSNTTLDSSSLVLRYSCDRSSLTLYLAWWMPQWVRQQWWQQSPWRQHSMPASGSTPWLPPAHTWPVCWPWSRSHWVTLQGNNLVAGREEMKALIDTMRKMTIMPPYHVFLNLRSYHLYTYSL